MSGRAEDAVSEAKQVMSDLAGYLRAVRYDLPAGSGVELETLAQRLEVIARDCQDETTFTRPKLYCVKG
ncbi:hypothetical protein [Sulfitobacter sp. DFL-23]|uniref:Uncharacterized protein n=1 Tax=Pseudosulfitobacter pseudonitzschiae TaxID=1402135 RepID=A0A221K3A0_9RHOB|nr:hypothetical protein [Sulfitobacter sp. DFL-23]ASM73343.1 hypothetical protein SULPSESMR1_02546 [Pseudosulfitobacter pseudonitzschiae]